MTGVLAALLPEVLFGAATLALFEFEAAIRFFFAGTFLLATVVGFRAAAAFRFLTGWNFFPVADFFALGAVVILPGRLGFLDAAFLPFVARIF
jgi:hypothetical protein